MVSPFEVFRGGIVIAFAIGAGKWLLWARSESECISTYNGNCYDRRGY